MKPFDDNDLIAYHLHELSPRRARALERALKTNPSLAADFNAYAVTLRSFKQGATVAVDDQVFARNWQSVLPSLRPHRAAPMASYRWRLPALAGAGLAFAATALFITAGRHHAAPPQGAASVRQPGLASPSIPPANGPILTSAPVIASRNEVQQQGHTARAFSSFPASSFQETRPRLIRPLPPSLGAPPVLHLIPLAHLSPLLLPEPSSLPITAEPAGKAQISPSDPRSKRKRERTSVHHEHPFDVTVAMGGTLIGTRTSGSDTDSITQGASHAVMAIGAFHQQIRPAVGYRIAVSYTRPGFQNSHTTAGISSGDFEVNSRIYELAATYVVQGPHHGGLSTSVEVGGGLMTFLPTLPNASISSNVRGAAVVGIAAEYALNKHVAIHAAYRGQVYKGPDFNYTGFNGPLGGVTLFSNEPMLGISYRFSHK